MPRPCAGVSSFRILKVNPDRLSEIVAPEEPAVFAMALALRLGLRLRRRNVFFRRTHRALGSVLRETHRGTLRLT